VKSRTRRQPETGTPDRKSNWKSETRKEGRKLETETRKQKVERGNWKTQAAWFGLAHHKLRDPANGAPGNPALYLA